MENQFCELPPDKAIDTKTFLDTVSHIPAFFGECNSIWSHTKTRKVTLRVPSRRYGVSLRTWLNFFFFFFFILRRLTTWAWFSRRDVVISLQKLRCRVTGTMSTSCGRLAYRETLCWLCEQSTHCPHCDLTETVHSRHFFFFFSSLFVNSWLAFIPSSEPGTCQLIHILLALLSNVSFLFQTA